VIAALLVLRTLVVRVRTAYSEGHGAFAEASGLALNAIEKAVALEDEVAACVLAVRDVEPMAERAENERDGECRDISDVLRVLHVATVAYASAGPCPLRTAVELPTMRAPPE
jgi:hypothetical protein